MLVLTFNRTLAGYIAALAKDNISTLADAPDSAVIAILCDTVSLREIFRFL